MTIITNHLKIHMIKKRTLLTWKHAPPAFVHCEVAYTPRNYQTVFSRGFCSHAESGVSAAQAMRHLSTLALRSTDDPFLAYNYLHFS